MTREGGDGVAMHSYRAQLVWMHEITCLRRHHSCLIPFFQSGIPIS